jgi:uncharacterized protein YbjT (DUF2867 family)
MRSAAPPASAHERVLLTGATGFVGQHLWPALIRAGYQVRCLTRNLPRAQERWPDRDWAQGDVADEDQSTRALEGCAAAYYLVHGMAEGGTGFRQHEIETAQRFARAAARAGVSRIVYLGGMRPQGALSEHLRSRLEVGEVLRGGSVQTVELRASMIIGAGSLSWLIVRDLAARLPLMVLPRWLKSRTQPVAIADVVQALLDALAVPLPGSESFDLPGPETLSAKEVLVRIASALGLRRPVMIEVPVLSPWLSSHWVRFVTRADWSVAREIVVGLTDDMMAQDDQYWKLTNHRDLVPFGEAVRQTLAAEERAAPAPGFWGGVERWMAARAPRPRRG